MNKYAIIVAVGAYLTTIFITSALITEWILNKFTKPVPLFDEAE